MSVIPTPWTVGVRAWSPTGGVDRQGNPVSTWAAPVQAPVHGVAPRVVTEPGDPNRHAVVEGLTVYAPPGTTVGPHDRVVIADQEYEVVGEVEDWTVGPWLNPAAGVVINVERVEG